MNIEERTAEPVQKPDEQAAAAALLEIQVLQHEIQLAETSLASNFVRLGNVLLRVRNDRFWIVWGHHSFGAYIKSLDMGRTQLYQIISVVEALLPVVGEEGLKEIGISKGIELRRVVTTTGSLPSGELIDKARDPAVKLGEIRELAFQEMHEKDLPPTGSYFHLGGFWATTDERAEIKQAFEVAKRTDPPIAHDLPEHSQLKEVILRMCREFYGTYAGVTGDK